MSTLDRERIAVLREELRTRLEEKRRVELAIYDIENEIDDLVSKAGLGDLIEVTS